MFSQLAAFDFATASLLMAVGIGTDVALATLGQANNMRHNKAALYWILGVTATHTLFPMFGYLLTYQSVQILPLLTPVVGVLAAGFIGWYIVSMMRELSEGETPSSHSNNRWTVSLGLILAVSWDALWSGPAKSAQVIGWPELFVWLSFAVVGAVIALLATFSLTFANRISQLLNQRGNLLLQWLQLSVVGYFGLLALLRYTFALNLHWLPLLFAAFALVGCGMMQIKSCREQLLSSRVRFLS